jgi:hypothetical protein
MEIRSQNSETPVAGDPPAADFCFLISAGEEPALTS